MTPSDPSSSGPAATLEEIKARAFSAQCAPSITRDWARGKSADDVPRLVAALEAVLELHQPMPNYGLADDGSKALCDHPFGADTDAHFEGDDGYWYCRGKKMGERCSSCADEDQADLWEDWPCPTYLAITREITGKGGPCQS